MIGRDNFSLLKLAQERHFKQIQKQKREKFVKEKNSKKRKIQKREKTEKQTKSEKIIGFKIETDKIRENHLDKNGKS